MGAPAATRRARVERLIKQFAYEWSSTGALIQVCWSSGEARRELRVTPSPAREMAQQNTDTARHTHTATQAWMPEEDGGQAQHLTTKVECVCGSSGARIGGGALEREPHRARVLKLALQHRLPFLARRRAHNQQTTTNNTNKVHALCDHRHRRPARALPLVVLALPGDVRRRQPPVLGRVGLGRRAGEVLLLAWAVASVFALCMTHHTTTSHKHTKKPKKPQKAAAAVARAVQARARDARRQRRL